MVSWRAQSPVQEDTRGSNDSNVIIEMHAAMDELCLQNQTLEDSDLNIQQLK